jgi:hypothetical protein
MNEDLRARIIARRYCYGVSYDDPRIGALIEDAWVAGWDRRGREHEEGHEYLSTSCLHAAIDGKPGLHDYCGSKAGMAAGGETWAKAPAQCKFCDSRCTCACHHQASSRAPE